MSVRERVRVSLRVRVRVRVRVRARGRILVTLAQGKIGNTGDLAFGVRITGNGFSVTG